MDCKGLHGTFLRNRGPAGIHGDWLGLTTVPKPSHELTPDKLPIGYAPVTWAELIRRLQAAGVVESRCGKGSHRQFVNPDNGRVVTVSVHTKKEVGTGLARRILKEAGL